MSLYILLPKTMQYGSLLARDVNEVNTELFKMVENRQER